MSRALDCYLSGLISSKTVLSLGALAVLCTGAMVLPVRAQSLSAGAGGVNATAANLPAAQADLFVNVSLGRDDLSAGRQEAAPFKTITFALQQAKPGMVIQIAPGNYSRETGESFPLVVPQGVTLRGNEFNQGNNTTVTGGGFTSSSWWGSQNVAILAKGNSQVIGLSVTNPNSRGTGIWIESATTTVRGCTFTNSAREGVFVTGTANPTLENNMFANNSANGVAFTGPSSGMVRNNTFQNTGFGIAVSDKSAPQLVNNRIQDNVDGVVISHSATPQLRGNIIEGNKRDGLVAISNAQPDLGNPMSPGRNTFRNNGRFAVYNATPKNAIALDGNDVMGTTQMTALAPQPAPSGEPTLAPTATESLPAVAPGMTPATNPTVVATPAAAPSPTKTAAKPNAQNPQPIKGQTVKYKGKTYILLEDAMKLNR